MKKNSPAVFLSALIVAITAGFLAVGFFVWDGESPHSAKRFMSSLPDPALEQGEVWGPHEDEIADVIIEQTKTVIGKNQDSSKFVHRDAHPKAHGCVKATWTNLPGGLTPDERVGIFAETAPIPTWIRFSNGSPHSENPDSKGDVRGMAMKLMTRGGNQDFVIMNSPRFFSKDAEDYLKFFTAVNAGGISLVKYLALHPRNALTLKNASVKVTDSLKVTYLSPVPLKLGNHSMRVKATPCLANGDSPVVDEAHPNYLRESLLETLKSREVCFDFSVQINRDPANNPIEDPRLLWDEKVSPFVPVAKITIAKQDDFTSSERMNFCENLSFNPWHTRPETRPLGQINRTRKVVYEAISRFRHVENRTAEIEPTDLTACAGSAAALCK